jgi:hypothetical protein
MSRRLIAPIVVVACFAATAGLSFAQPNTDPNTSNEPMQMDGGRALTSDLYDAGQSASAAGDAGRSATAWEASAAKPSTAWDGGRAEPTAAWDASRLQPTTAWEAGPSQPTVTRDASVVTR